jgi:subtilisin-like proprotein convertase family protein/uncharacterized protein YvpB
MRDADSSSLQARLANMQIDLFFVVCLLFGFLTFLSFMKWMPVSGQSPAIGDIHDVVFNSMVGTALRNSAVDQVGSPVYRFLPVVFHQPPTPPVEPIPTEERLFCTSSTDPISIPDDDPGGVESHLSILESKLIVDLDVYLRLDHTWIGDLLVTLTNETTGKVIPLIDRAGFPTSQYGCGGDDIIAILDDGASQGVEMKCASTIPAISGTYRPDEPLRMFTGDPVAGDWTVRVADLSSGDRGNLVKWCLAATLADRMPEPIPPPPPPDLPDQEAILGMAGKDQALNLDCESRSAVDWAAYFGVKIDEMEFFGQLPESDDPDEGFVGDVNGKWGQIPPNPYGVHAAPVAALLRAYGLAAYAHRNLTWDDIRAEVSAGRPAIVWVIAASDGSPPGRYYPVYYTASSGKSTVVSPYEHTAIVIGYTSNSVMLLDGGKVYIRTLTQFLDSWSVLRNMAILTSP